MKFFFSTFAEAKLVELSMQKNKYFVLPQFYTMDLQNPGLMFRQVPTILVISKY